MSIGAVALRRRLVVAFAVAAILFGLSSPARAGDAVLEISQTCAVQTGCFTGDAAGFPVTIGTLAGARSFRLTSDLVLASTATNAITISASDVRLDLAGFSIRGPVVCSGTPLSCSAGGGSGVGISSSGTFNGVEVFDGTVVGMSVGVSLGNGAEIRDLRARSNALEGVKALGDAEIDGVSAYRNGGSGISISSGVIARSISQENGKVGVFVSSGRGEVHDCAIRGNADSGIASSGGALRATGNVVTNNAGDGISAGPGSLVVGNIASGNTAGDGIATSGGSSILDNTVSANQGFGLALTGSHNAYRGNTINDNVAGTVSGAATAANQGANSCNGAASCP